jgi:hypothetical protein
MAKHHFYPETGDRDFGAMMHSKLEMTLDPSKELCPRSPGLGGGSAKFDLHPMQQFVTTFLSPTTPYKSLLLFHGTGVGKTGTATSVVFGPSGSENLVLKFDSSGIADYGNVVLELDQIAVLSISQAPDVFGTVRGGGSC